MPAPFSFFTVCEPEEYKLRFLLIGDIFGSCGMDFVSTVLNEVVDEENIDFVIANAENASGGNGLSYADYDALMNLGVDVITMGNHTFGRKDIFKIFENENNVIRPLNYPCGTAGKGSVTVNAHGKRICVINAMGRVNIMNIDCPFRALEAEIKSAKADGADIIIVDFHADETSEKRAMGYFLDGKATCVFGTHTHVQTADETILPKGTAYISDVGMTGAVHSVLGVEPQVIIDRFLTSMPQRFEHADGKAKLCGAVLEVDDSTNSAVSIKRIIKL